MKSFRQYILEAKATYKDLSLDTLKSYVSKLSSSTKPEDRIKLNAINSELRRRGENTDTSQVTLATQKHSQKGKIASHIDTALNKTNTRKVIVSKDDKNIAQFKNTKSYGSVKTGSDVKDLVSTHGRGNYTIKAVPVTDQQKELRKNRQELKKTEPEEYKQKAVSKFIDKNASELPDWKRRDLTDKLVQSGTQKKLGITALNATKEPDSVEKLEAQMRNREQAEENYHRSGAYEKDKLTLDQLKKKLKGN